MNCFSFSVTFFSIFFTLNAIKLGWTVCVLLTFIPIHTIHTNNKFRVDGYCCWCCCASLYWILLKFYSLRSIGGVFLLLLICVTWRMMIILFWILNKCFMYVCRFECVFFLLFSHFLPFISHNVCSAGTLLWIIIHFVNWSVGVSLSVQNSKFKINSS